MLLPTYLSTQSHLFIHSTILSIYSPIHLTISLYICLSIRPLIHLFIYPYIRYSTHLSVYLSHPPAYGPIHPPIQQTHRSVKDFLLREYLLSPIKVSFLCSAGSGTHIDSSQEQTLPTSPANAWLLRTQRRRE